MAEIQYPVRCQLVEGDPHDGPPRDEDNSPYVGEFGVAEIKDGAVVIHLDSGVEIPDSRCWWREVLPPQDDDDNA